MSIFFFTVLWTLWTCITLHVDPVVPAPSAGEALLPHGMILAHTGFQSIDYLSPLSPNHFDYCSFVLSLMRSECEYSTFVLFQDFFGLSGSFVIPYEF